MTSHVALLEAQGLVLILYSQYQTHESMHHPSITELVLPTRVSQFAKDLLILED